MTSKLANKIILGSCEQVLARLPDNVFDGVITDPPYGLGTKEPTARDIKLYLQGKPLDTGGDFMGLRWQIPSVPTWRECYRVLKPGGYVLSFASTRTWDIMSIGLRAAGFDNRNTLSSKFGSPCLQWLHGQGFPKSTNISKKILERAKKKGLPQQEVERLKKLAKLFEGYGTALKPAWEPILCFRKPLIEPTLADRVAVTGAGGIAIEGTHLKHASVEGFEKHKELVERIEAEGGSWDRCSEPSGAVDVTAAGRWPPNVVLTHTPECRQVGVRMVPAPIISRFKDGIKPFGEGAGHPYETSGGGDEEIPVFQCAEGCVVKILDEQRGAPRSESSNQDVAGARRGPEDPAVHANFELDAPFYYTAKASKKERTIGQQVENRHQTVKPLELMRWLVRLAVPRGGILLDPYGGSGTTALAAVAEGRQYCLIERDAKYRLIAFQRVTAARGAPWLFEKKRSRNGVSTASGPSTPPAGGVSHTESEGSHARASVAACTDNIAIAGNVRT